MSTIVSAITLSTLLLSYIVASKDYSDCRWFGNTTNAPFYPLDICSAHSHETELDGLTLYSTRMECTDNGELAQYEWENTECSGDPYHTQTYRKEDGYYFNCDAQTSCPFTKIILWELSDVIPYSNDSSDHNNHICAYDTQKYHEISIVTNICIDLIEEYNMSFYIDCSAQQVTYQEYSDINCKNKVGGNFSKFTISEGCDDPFDFNSYVQIAECDDANYKPYEKEHNHLALIFTVIVALVIIVLAIMIAATFVKRKNQTIAIKSANVQQEIQESLINVDFQSIGDAVDEPKATQDITTEGQDIKEIPIYKNNGNMR